ncbi:hypothetical protein ACLEX4_08255 [Pseudescherichia vulneris]
MRCALGFKKRYFLLIPITLAVFFIYWISHFSLLEQEILKKLKVNNLANLYVTEASAGATTGFSYRYYLFDAKKSDADFMAHIDDETPFMITSDSKATATVSNGQLYLRVRGDIYSFQSGSYQASVHLDAAPY